MKRLSALFLKFSAWLVAVLKPLGFWGAGVLALLDSSTIPVPMDLIISGYVWADPRHFYLYSIMAAIGSSIGGLLPFFLGRAGGELFLLKRVDRQRFEQLRDRFEKQEFFAVFVPSMLPPPTPWKLFVFGAGVFEMHLRDFLAAVFLGRLVRFTVEALLVIRYGPQIVTMVHDLARQHSAALLALLCAVFAVLIYLGLRQVRKRRKRKA
ncbi:YqaA family protein [Pseudacidobacterium ailaaui]|uniref:YqaA family protein n=1 Tax=Pseudacidobacterium ailaaui TaxID=1382359 RepID=UPI0005D1623C|nr:VTT domain-containing protein [Pseudacidobacterium ailaaui]MDI3255276.1 VTT domain-containing protein [Bacillota bacterium]